MAPGIYKRVLGSGAKQYEDVQPRSQLVGAAALAYKIEIPSGYSFPFTWESPGTQQVVRLIRLTILRKRQLS